MLHIHPNARTTPATRAEIARSTEPSGTVAERYGISAETVRKWRKRGAADCLDRSARPHNLPWKASEEERAIVCTLRRTTSFPLDDLTFVVCHVLPHLNRDSVWRILKAEGLNRRPKPFSERPAKGQGTFRDYDLGFVHIDIKHLPKLQTSDGERRKRFLYVAIDRCSRSVHLAVKDDETERSAIAFLREAAAAFPFQLTYVLTDNGSCFTPAFAKACAKLGAQYRHTKPRTPQTNGMVERFNGRIASEVLGINVYSHRALEQLLRGFNTAYNARRQRVLDGRTPNQLVAEHLKAKPELANPARHGRAGPCDTTKARLIADAAKEVSQPDRYGYSRFCDLYAVWRGRLSPTMRQTHPAGERLFVDDAGQTVTVTDGATGEARQAQMVVAALGASNFTDAEARWTQSLPDWLGCHVGAFAHMGGVARQLVCDNLKSGVTAASRYEPGISRAYQDLASHDGTAVLPARVRRPRDKAQVEVAVQVVQRWVLARLRHRRFFSLAELNGAIRELIAELNNRPMRHLGTSRRALFEAIERAALLPLPMDPYAYGEWKRCRAGLDYHVDVHGHVYSVPYRLMREVIEARITDQTIELFHQGSRIASHVRNPRQHRHTTTSEHMPSAHRRFAEWTPTRLLHEAAAVGPSTLALVERILAAKPHPEQGFRACLGILRLVRSYGPERLEAACQRGPARPSAAWTGPIARARWEPGIGAKTYGSVQSILRHREAIPRSDVGNADSGLDRAHRADPVPDELSVQHGNIRGSGSYH